MSKGNTEFWNQLTFARDLAVLFWIVVLFGLLLVMLWHA